MKKIIFLVTILTAFTTVYAQDSATATRLSQLLQSYYNIKNALVADDSRAASESATTFIKNLNGISYKAISEGNVSILLNDATNIARTKNIGKQRVAFSSLSANMIAVARAVKLTEQPVYILYCPMKKASWLSSKQTIENPYYGSAMLTCGKVSDTIR